MRLGEDAGNLLHTGLVHALGLLDLLAILEDNDGWDLGHVEVGLRTESVDRGCLERKIAISYLGSLVLGDIDLVGSGGGGELLGVPGHSQQAASNQGLSRIDLLIGLWVDGALVGVDEDVLARGLEGLVEFGLAVELGVRHVGCCGGKVWVKSCERRREVWLSTGFQKKQDLPGDGAALNTTFSSLSRLWQQLSLVETHYGEGDCLAVKHEHRHKLQEIGSGER